MSGTGLEVSPDMDPEDVLAHYGVKGMQWGKRKADDGSSGGGGSSKPSNDDIKNARENIRREAVDYRKAKKEAKKTTVKGSAERLLADEKVAEMKVDFLNNPDRVTAMRLTTGDKLVAGALAAFPGSTVGVASNLAVRSITRKHIEKKQKTGAYYK